MAEPTKPDHPPPKNGFFVSVGSLVSARAFLAVSQILVLPIIARHVSVEDFAVIALAMTVVVFCQVLSDAGMGRSLIRSDSYDPEEWSSVFWFLVLVGMALALATLLLSFLWAHLFDLPTLVPVMCTLSVIPLCQAISAAPNAEVERREDYTGIARVQILTTVISLGLAVLLAVLGFGVWALVAQQVALAVVRLIGILRLSKFRPHRAFKVSRLKPHMKFAVDALSVSTIFSVAEQGVVMLVGKFLGNQQLGLFAMSRRFSRLPQYGLAGPVSSVVYVRMAKAKDNNNRLVDIYLSSMRLLSFAILPAMAAVAMVGWSLFPAFLSDEWRGVAAVFALSIIGFAIEAVTITCLACLFRAKGRTDLNVRLTAESAALRLGLVLTACFISLEAVAAAFALWGVLIAPRGWALAQRIVDLPYRDCLVALAPALAAAAEIILSVATLSLTTDLGQLSEILAGMALWALVTGAMFLANRRAILDAMASFRT